MNSVSNYGSLVKFPQITKSQAMTAVVIAIGLIAASIFAPPLGGAIVLSLAIWKIGVISAALAGLGAVVCAVAGRFFKKTTILSEEQTVKEEELKDKTAQDSETVIAGIVRDLNRNFRSSIEIDGKTIQIRDETTLRGVFASLKKGLGEEKATQVLSYFYQSAFARDTSAALTAANKKTDEMLSYNPTQSGDNNNGIHVTVRDGICSVTVTTDQKGELIPSNRKVHIYCHSTVANIFEKEMSVTRTIRLTNL
jgi:hypothetical protein